MEINPLQYPIGRFSAPEVITSEIREKWILILKEFPEKLEFVAKQLSNQQLETAYREGSWTARQVIHHLFDSHLHCYIRMKAVLTEGENPTIKDYNENAYAMLQDGCNAPIDMSILGIKGLHARWGYFLDSLEESDWTKTYYHPTRAITYPLDRVIGIYAWHSMHHLAHLEIIRKA
jgi:hypothetical protein